MTTTPIMYLKYALIAIVEVAIGAAMLAGKIEVTPAVGLMTGAVGMLVLSLGLTSAGQQIGQQTALAIQAHTRAMIAGVDAADQVKRAPGVGPQRGFVSVRALLALMGGAALVVIGILALTQFFACTKQEGQAVETVGENVAICVLNVTAQDIAAGITDEGQIATDAVTKCIGAAATSTQKAGVVAILEASTKLRLARAPGQ